MRRVELTEHEHSLLLELVAASRDVEAARAALVAAAQVRDADGAVRASYVAALALDRQRMAARAFLLAAPFIRMEGASWEEFGVLLVLEALFLQAAEGRGSGIPGPLQRAWWLSELLNGPQHPEDTEALARALFWGAGLPSRARLFQALRAAFLWPPAQ